MTGRYQPITRETDAMTITIKVFKPNGCMLYLFFKNNHFIKLNVVIDNAVAIAAPTPPYKGINIKFNTTQNTI